MSQETGEAYRWLSPISRLVQWETSEGVPGVGCWTPEEDPSSHISNL